VKIPKIICAARARVWLPALWLLHHYQEKLILPGREITGSASVAIVGNGRQTASVIQVAPCPCIDDGLLDVLVVRQISPTALLAAARELQQLPAMANISSIGSRPG
jgi:hypothetical protein